MHKPNTVYPYNEILFSQEKWSTHYNLDEFWKHYAKQEKPNTHIHTHTYTHTHTQKFCCVIHSYEIPRINKSTETQNRLPVERAREQRGWGVKLPQSCPTVCKPMDCSPSGSSSHDIFQARILEWVATSFSRWSSPPRDPTQFS